jgi:hypothetical protein
VRSNADLCREIDGLNGGELNYYELGVTAAELARYRIELLETIALLDAAKVSGAIIRTT